jgi:hypothetical protein
MGIATEVESSVRTVSEVSMPPRLGALLTELVEVPDIGMALRKVLSEYLELKDKTLEERIAAFEAKWGMSFDEFSRKCAEGTLAEDAYSYEVEKDFWEWEQAVTLQNDYLATNFTNCHEKEKNK